MQKGTLKDISVVVQGPVYKKLTLKCLNSIRKHLPGAEIILSTWKGSDIDGLDHDILILNDDPGFYLYQSNHAAKNNVNRQIATTLAGLKAAAHKYAFKIRTDFIISGRGFLNYFDNFQKYDIGYKVFNRKILSCVFFARNPRPKTEFPPYPFHPSDIAFFGLREDLLNLFDVPFMTKEEAVTCKTHEGINFCRYVPEQYIWVNCLRKNGHKINFDHQRDISGKNIEDTEKYAVSNFIYLDWKQFNLIPPKHLVLNENNKVLQFDDVITHIEWQRLYKQYLDNSLAVPDRDDLRKLINRKTSVWVQTGKNLTENRGSKMKFIIKRLVKLIRRVINGEIMRVLNEDVVHVLNDNVMRTLNDDIVREINHMKTEIQYMKSVFAKREHLFDMAADIKNHISLLHDNNEKTRS
jgi:hypothetical protein